MSQNRRITAVGVEWKCTLLIVAHVLLLLLLLLLLLRLRRRRRLADGGWPGGGASAARGTHERLERWRPGWALRQLWRCAGRVGVMDG